MKKKILVLLLLFSFSIFAQAPEPSKDMSIGEELTDIDEKGRIGAKNDKKIFANMLFFYAQVRQTAEGSLEMLKSVSDFALKSFNVLVRIENIVKTAQKLKEEFGKFPELAKDAKNPFDLLDKTVTHTYKNMIVGGTDVMWIQTAGMGNDLAALNDSRKGIAVATLNMGEIWDLEKSMVWNEDSSEYSVYFEQKGEKMTLEDYNSKKAERKAENELKEADIADEMKLAEEKKAKMDSIMQKDFSAQLRYQSKMAMQAVNMTDPRLVEKYEFNPNAKRKAALSQLPSSAIGNANARKQQHENNFWEIQYAMSMAANAVGEETSITAAASAEVLGAQNLLMGTYGEHEGLNDFVTIMSGITMSNLGKMTTNVHCKANMVVSAGNIASIVRRRLDELEKNE